MINRLPFLMLGAAALIACQGEQAIDDSAPPTDDTGDTTDTQTDNDSIATATPVTFSEGAAQISDAIEEAGDRDFYAISAVEGTYYVLMAARWNVDGGEPDTVIRVYDPEENMIGENDDLPYRIGDTDAGYIFRAATTGTYYAEVLEWSDWDAGSAADGGDTWDYDFVALELGIGELLPDNNTIGAADTALETLKDADDTNNEFQWYGDPWVNTYLFTPGAIEAAGDVDYYGSWADNSDAGTYTGETCQWSVFPGIDTDLDYQFELYKEDGTKVAETSSPDVTPNYTVFYDAGITYPIDSTGGDYFLKVSDASGGGGTSHWYSLLHVCYPHTFVPTTGSPEVQVVVETEGSDTALFMRESTATAGYFYGRMAGFMNAGSGADVDTWTVNTGVSGASTLGFEMDVSEAGSLMMDAKFTVYDSDGSTVLAQDMGLDPSQTEVAISPSGSTLTIEVTSDSGVTGDGYYYLGILTLE